LKPLRTRIQEAARRSKVPQEVIEKDYLLSYTLAGIAAVPPLAPALAFKGGTALKKCVFGEYRFSEDLDFSGMNAPKGEALEQALHRAVDESRRLLAQQGPFALDIQRYLERDPHPGGQEAFIIRAQFPWHPQPLCRVKIEISHDEPVMLPTRDRTVRHGYEEELTVILGCYQLEEIVAEKMRSLLQTQQKLIRRGWNQARARDYYDLWRILTQFQNELDRTILDELLHKKCEVRSVSFRVLDDFFTEELVSQAQKHWAATLSPFVPDLASSDQVLVELKKMLPGFFKFAQESSA
jgi:predicted nucleotidyltransferase component of viral defense system